MGSPQPAYRSCLAPEFFAGPWAGPRASFTAGRWPALFALRLDLKPGFPGPAAAGPVFLTILMTVASRG